MLHFHCKYDPEYFKGWTVNYVDLKNHQPETAHFWIKSQCDAICLQEEREKKNKIKNNNKNTKPKSSMKPTMVTTLRIGWALCILQATYVKQCTFMGSFKNNYCWSKNQQELYFPWDYLFYNKMYQVPSICQCSNKAFLAQGQSL